VPGLRVLALAARAGLRAVPRAGFFGAAGFAALVRAGFLRGAGVSGFSRN
jgi:hypothetical protein